MAVIIKMRPTAGVKHLLWKCARDKFVTCCEDGNVILDGKVMTLSDATSILLKTTGVPPSFFWEKSIW